jgi:DNA-directed RNA polymerase specialized sigma24 family protein
MVTPEQDEKSSFGGAGHFVTTHWSVVQAAGSKDSSTAQAALETLCRAYWFPIYAEIRRRGFVVCDAQDLTQGFFASLLESHSFRRPNRDRGRFRSWLLGALHHFLAHERDRARAAKRGGGRMLIPLDEALAEERLLQEASLTASPEELFAQRWAYTLLDLAFQRVEREYSEAGKAILFATLKEFLADDSDHGSYGRLAEKLGTTAGAVATAVCRLRERFRAVIREEVLQTVAAPGDAESELRELFGC